jgi:hypothetical protein
MPRNAAPGAFGVDEVEFAVRGAGRADAGAPKARSQRHPQPVVLLQQRPGHSGNLADYPGIDLVGPIDSTAEQTTNFAAWRTS